MGEAGPSSGSFLDLLENPFVDEAITTSHAPFHAGLSGVPPALSGVTPGWEPDWTDDAMGDDDAEGEFEEEDEEGADGDRQGGDAELFTEADEDEQIPADVG